MVILYSSFDAYISGQNHPQTKFSLIFSNIEVQIIVRCTWLMPVGENIMVYGSVTVPIYSRFAHKDDPLQVSVGRPVPTISPMSCVKHQIIVYTCIVITCIIFILLLALSQVLF